MAVTESTPTPKVGRPKKPSAQKTKTATTVATFDAPRAVREKTVMDTTRVMWGKYEQQMTPHVRAILDTRGQGYYVPYPITVQNLRMIESVRSRILDERGRHVHVRTDLKRNELCVWVV